MTMLNRTKGLCKHIEDHLYMLKRKRLILTGTLKCKTHKKYWYEPRQLELQ